jgi:1-deoxy-D-xylulose-5-phosphate synthase
MTVRDISSPEDIKKLNTRELAELSAAIRAFLIDHISQTGGHLASNLGVVELTLAIHRVFDTAKDRLVFDVGHQSYVHKIITGRGGRFGTLRGFGGISGFPRPDESLHDAFIAGHASNSISVAVGLARARTLAGKDHRVIALIGDGALTGGLSFEGLSDAGASGEPLIVILNDNGMSITENVGGIARYLSRQRLRPSYAKFKIRYRKFLERLPGGQRIYRTIHRLKTAVKNAILHCSVFEEMGFEYLGPVDGHDTESLTRALVRAKTLEQPVLVHVITRKGKGYTFSEHDPDKYHGVAPFNIKTGAALYPDETFSSVFGAALCEIAREDRRVCAVTASMTDGTGLTKFAEEFPERFFDVGIAEGHAVSMAAGLSAGGMIAVVAVYSTFLQRAYDMLIHDMALSGGHAVLCVDRAGIVPGDGETHQGVFDVAMLTSAPGFTVLCPSNFAELAVLLRAAVCEIQGPVAVRYPRGGEGAYRDGRFSWGGVLREGEDLTIAAYGIMINTALEAAELLEEQGINAEVLKLGQIAPLRFDDILRSVNKTRRLIVVEDCVEAGCVGGRIAARLLTEGVEADAVVLKNLGDTIPPCGDIASLCKLCGLDAESIAASIISAAAEVCHVR